MHHLQKHINQDIKGDKAKAYFYKLSSALICGHDLQLYIIAKLSVDW